MARQGFPRMGISACFGGPLLSKRPSVRINDEYNANVSLLDLLFGIGLPYTIILSEKGTSLFVSDKFDQCQTIISIHSITHNLPFSWNTLEWQVYYMVQ